MSTRRSRELLYVAFVLTVFGPGIFLTWQTFQLADRSAHAEGLYTGIAAAHCEPKTDALVATWSEIAVRQIWRDVGQSCREAERWRGNVDAEHPRLSGNLDRDFTVRCAPEDGPDEFGQRFKVSTVRFEQACAVRAIALRTFRATVSFSVLGVVAMTWLARRSIQE